MSRNVKCWDASVRSQHVANGLQQHKAKNPQRLTNLNELFFGSAKMRVCVLTTSIV